MTLYVTIKYNAAETSWSEINNKILVTIFLGKKPSKDYVRQMGGDLISVKIKGLALIIYKPETQPPARFFSSAILEKSSSILAI